MTREVPLTRGFVTLVDDDDYETVVCVGSWKLDVCDGRLYAGRWLTPTASTVRLHSFLTGFPLVDHRNGDGLDNRRANLRQATPSQNAANRWIGRNNTSGLKGVAIYKRTGRWRACIGSDGKQIHLGYFDSAEAAAAAYDEAAVSLFGEFARLNFPKDAT